MAVLSFAGDERRVDRDAEVAERLREFGVEYERWDLSRVGEDASAEEVLAAYALEIEAMKERGGYTTADVIDIVPETPGLEAMLARFDKEHTHSEDEVRFILAGRGIFFLNVDGGAGGEAASGDESGAGRRVLSVEVHAGDMLRVPRGTTHWFTLCGERRIRAIRWFQKATGWTPEYTDSGVDRAHQPLCFGPAYLGARVETKFAV